MTSPKARRRQRSRRLTAAAVLLVTSAALVGAALLSGSTLQVSVAAVLAVALGSWATHVTYTELRVGRREAARDRAAVAQDYRALAEQTAVDHVQHLELLQRRLDVGERAVTELESALQQAQGRAAEARRKASAEATRADRAEDEAAGLAVRLDSAESQVSEAMIRLAELEQENDIYRAQIDALRSELVAWQSVPRRSVS